MKNVENPTNDYKPHHLFWKGFWQGIGGFCALGLCTYLVSRIPQWRQPVIGFVLNLVPPDNKVWPRCLFLYLLGFLCLAVAFLYPFLKLKYQFKKGIVFDAIGPYVPFPPKANEQTPQDRRRQQLNEFAHQIANRPSPMAFHVLKWFSTLSEIGAADVATVSHICQLSHQDALSCVQELWRLELILTVFPAPGEWNGRYAITNKGMDYVRMHAT